jgi:hypothetical protein
MIASPTSVLENHAASPAEDSLRKLETWLVNHDYQGIDPFDALRSPILRRLRFNSRWLGVAWVQLFRRSPVNLRGLVRISPAFNAKGMGLFLAAYVRRYQVTRAAEDWQRIHEFATWLLENRCRNFAEWCWGYNFDWPNRAFFAPAGTPNIVSTVFISHALLDRFDVFGCDEDLAAARSACDFLLKRLASLKDSTGECFGYTPLDRRYVHNANLLGASLLARVGIITGESRLTARARSAASFTVARQQADGAWPYGIASADGFIDNFHTGFDLVNLLDYARLTGDNSFDDNIERGYTYWNKTFFTAGGLPKYFSGRLYPIDIHSVAQAILTFLAFRHRDPQASFRASQLAEWAGENMQDASGHFHYQIGRYWRNRIPYIRWSQAWMFRALAELCLQNGKGCEPMPAFTNAGKRESYAR